MADETEIVARKVFEIEGNEYINGIFMNREFYPLLFEEGRIDDIKLKSNDILIASYIRSGTTWLSQILTLMLAGKEKFDKVSKIEITERVPFLEIKLPHKDQSELFAAFLQSTPPRIGKTHLQFQNIKEWIVRDGVKAVVPLRNPKDTLVSVFYFYQTTSGIDFTGTWDEFFEHVKEGKTLFGNPVEWILSWWVNRNKNIHFVQYEDLLNHPEMEIRKMAAFLGVDLSESLLEKILHTSSFQHMKMDPATNYENNVLGISNFIRKGRPGVWKDYFTVAQNEWFDNKYRAQIEQAGVEVCYD